MVEIPEGLRPYEPAIRRWLAYKGERREGYKSLGLAALWSTMGKLGADLPACVEHAMASGWKGVFPLKRSCPAANDTPAAIDETAQRMARRRATLRATVDRLFGLSQSPMWDRRSFRGATWRTFRNVEVKPPEPRFAVEVEGEGEVVSDTCFERNLLRELDDASDGALATAIETWVGPVQIVREEAMSARRAA